MESRHQQFLETNRSEPTTTMTCPRSEITWAHKTRSNWGRRRRKCRHFRCEEATCGKDVIGDIPRAPSSRGGVVSGSTSQAARSSITVWKGGWRQKQICKIYSATTFPPSPSYLRHRRCDSCERERSERERGDSRGFVPWDKGRVFSRKNERGMGNKVGVESWKGLIEHIVREGWD
jgi:hypothetical protein